MTTHELVDANDETVEVAAPPSSGSTPDAALVNDVPPVELAALEESPLAKRVRVAASGLPILGNPAATEIRYVLHYSRKRNIVEFEARGWCCWTDVVSAHVKTVALITNDLDPAAYSAIYVLRIGLPEGATDLCESDYFSDHTMGNIGFCCEYALGKEVHHGDFGRIDIALNNAGTHFE